jgi:putative two-component system response regulator
MMIALRDTNLHFRSDKIPTFSDPAITAQSLLIIDDQEANIRSLEAILHSAGYQDVRGISDPRLALAACRQRRPDLIVLDLQLPHITGLPLMKLLLEEFSDEIYSPILVLTADLTPDAKAKALACGAKDFVPKPFDSAELLLRIANLLKTRALYQHIEQHNRSLEQKWQEEPSVLAKAEIAMLHCLALAAEYRDDETGQHPQRVGCLAKVMAEAVGQSPEQVELIGLAAPLHDVGKIGIPDRILLKPGRLTPDEYSTMKTHTIIGQQILSRSDFPVMQVARQIALSHHERWDGGGYPQGLIGESIPLVARITAIADVFDALTHARPYKDAWSVERALDTIKRERGRHFDPALASVFLSVVGGSGFEKLLNGLQADASGPKAAHATALQRVTA